MPKKGSKPAKRYPAELREFTRDLGLLVGFHLSKSVKRREDIKAILRDTVAQVDTVFEMGQAVAGYIKREFLDNYKGG